jgi:hypothetical protein
MGDVENTTGIPHGEMLLNSSPVPHRHLKTSVLSQMTIYLMKTV